MNKIYRKILITVSFATLILSCKNQEKMPMSFFVAGHVYGSPYDTLPGIHPPFQLEKEYLRSYQNMKFGVFTGDIVNKSKSSHWDSVDVFIEALGYDVHFAVGNHDEGHKTLYTSRYGKTYYSWNQNGNLFIVLNPLLYGWIINQDQLKFLKECLENVSEFRNIFIFFHQVLWEDRIDRTYGILPNSFEGRADSINFDSEIIPLLKDTQKPVFLFAGDVGATLDKTAIAVVYKDNITMIASGMGSGKNDNYIIVDIDTLGKVKLHLRWMDKKATHEILCCNELVFPKF